LVVVVMVIHFAWSLRDAPLQIEQRKDWLMGPEPLSSLVTVFFFFV
jgi:hypothetical protein